MSAAVEESLAANEEMKAVRGRFKIFVSITENIYFIFQDLTVRWSFSRINRIYIHHLSSKS